MKGIAARTFAAAVAFSSLATVTQAEVTSDIVGYVKVGAYSAPSSYTGLPGGSDTLVSPPFTRQPEFSGKVASFAGNVITVAGTPAWTANKFVYVANTQPKTYYALIGSATAANPLEGRVYDITANGTNTLTVDLNGDSLNGLPADAKITVIPYWTLATLFPAANAGVSFTATTATNDLKTQVLVPDSASIGTNLPPSASYYFFNGAWRKVGDAETVNHNDDVVIPEKYITVRNPAGTTTKSLVVMGNVPSGKLAVPLATAAAAPQDNPVAFLSPLDTTLNGLGLGPTNGFTASPNPRAQGDLLLVFDNSSVSLNKSSSKSYYFYNGAWRLFGDVATVDHGTDAIKAGSGLMIRKAANGTGATAFWNQSH
jgi:uncharacterized protein (TIGR02597 family)